MEWVGARHKRRRQTTVFRRQLHARDAVFTLNGGETRDDSLAVSADTLRKIVSNTHGLRDVLVLFGRYVDKRSVAAPTMPLPLTSNIEMHFDNYTKLLALTSAPATAGDSSNLLLVSLVHTIPSPDPVSRVKLNISHLLFAYPDLLQELLTASDVVALGSATAKNTMVASFLSSPIRYTSPPQRREESRNVDTRFEDCAYIRDYGKLTAFTLALKHNLPAQAAQLVQMGATVDLPALSMYLIEHCWPDPMDEITETFKARAQVAPQLWKAKDITSKTKDLNFLGLLATRFKHAPPGRFDRKFSAKLCNLLNAFIQHYPDLDKENAPKYPFMEVVFAGNKELFPWFDSQHSARNSNVRTDLAMSPSILGNFFHKYNAAEILQSWKWSSNAAPLVSFEHLKEWKYIVRKEKSSLDRLLESELGRLLYLGDVDGQQVLLHCKEKEATPYSGNLLHFTLFQNESNNVASNAKFLIEEVGVDVDEPFIFYPTRRSTGSSGSNNSSIGSNSNNSAPQNFKIYPAELACLFAKSALPIIFRKKVKPQCRPQYISRAIILFDQALRQLYKDQLATVPLSKRKNAVQPGLWATLKFFIAQPAFRETLIKTILDLPALLRVCGCPVADILNLVLGDEASGKPYDVNLVVKQKEGLEMPLLHILIAHADLEFILKLEELGARWDKLDNDGNNALHSIVKTLWYNNESGETPRPAWDMFQLALKRDDVALLMTIPNKYRMTPLMYAILGRIQFVCRNSGGATSLSEDECTAILDSPVIKGMITRFTEITNGLVLPGFNYWKGIVVAGHHSGGVLHDLGHFFIGRLEANSNEFLDLRTYIVPVFGMFSWLARKSVEYARYLQSQSLKPISAVLGEDLISDWKLNSYVTDSGNVTPLELFAKNMRKMVHAEQVPFSECIALLKKLGLRTGTELSVQEVFENTPKATLAVGDLFVLSNAWKERHQHSKTIAAAGISGVRRDPRRRGTGEEDIISSQPQIEGGIGSSTLAMTKPQPLQTSLLQGSATVTTYLMSPTNEAPMLASPPSLPVALPNSDHAMLRGSMRQLAPPPSQTTSGASEFEASKIPATSIDIYKLSAQILTLQEAIKEVQLDRVQELLKAVSGPEKPTLMLSQSTETGYTALHALADYTFGMSAAKVVHRCDDAFEDDDTKIDLSTLLELLVKEGGMQANDMNSFSSLSLTPLGISIFNDALSEGAKDKSESALTQVDTIQPVSIVSTMTRCLMDVGCRVDNCIDPVTGRNVIHGAIQVWLTYCINQQRVNMGKGGGLKFRPVRAASVVAAISTFMEKGVDLNLLDARNHSPLDLLMMCAGPAFLSGDDGEVINWSAPQNHHLMVARSNLSESLQKMGAAFGLMIKLYQSNRASDGNMASGLSPTLIKVESSQGNGCQDEANVSVAPVNCHLTTINKDPIVQAFYWAVREGDEAQIVQSYGRLLQERTKHEACSILDADNNLPIHHLAMSATLYRRQRITSKSKPEKEIHNYQSMVNLITMMTGSDVTKWNVPNKYGLTPVELSILTDSQISSGKHPLFEAFNTAPKQSLLTDYLKTLVGRRTNFISQNQQNSIHGVVKKSTHNPEMQSISGVMDPKHIVSAIIAFKNLGTDLNGQDTVGHTPLDLLYAQCAPVFFQSRADNALNWTSEQNTHVRALKAQFESYLHAIGAVSGLQLDVQRMVGTGHSQIKGELKRQNGSDDFSAEGAFKRVRM
ncbi:hypothetical protein BC830DRAFT_1076747 [Chytriomyces sp. MP71]|nr:hypothetical protein BC830DRAFT_1076747 [Chytriomyces sp. MP71]